MQRDPKKEPGTFFIEPEMIMQATEACGFIPTGELLQLNSYENRVFQIGLEPGSFSTNKVIAKFYRPQRWSKEALEEEHQFLAELHDEGIKAVAPIQLAHGSTLFPFQGMWLSFFPRISGKMPEEFLPGDLKSVGRLLARVHNVGARKKAKHRPILGAEGYGGWQTLELLQRHISPEVRHRYNAAAEEILTAVEEQIDPSCFHRIHGDTHRGNLLLDSQKNFFLVDFDDFGMGPAIQDFWMLLSSDGEEGQEEVLELLSGYEELREFDDQQIYWIPLLRGLRLIGYAGWIAARWSDPSFLRIFPEFGSYRYWAEETEALEKIRRSHFNDNF